MNARWNGERRALAIGGLIVLGAMLAYAIFAAFLVAVGQAPPW